MSTSRYRSLTDNSPSRLQQLTTASAVEKSGVWFPAGAKECFSLHNVQCSSGSHSVFYPVRHRRLFFGSKAYMLRNWPLTPLLALPHAVLVCWTNTVITLIYHLFYQQFKKEAPWTLLRQSDCKLLDLYARLFLKSFTVYGCANIMEENPFSRLGMSIS